MNLKLISDIQNLQGKTVLVRLDWNVKKDSRDILKTRIARSFRTLDYLVDRGAKVIVLTHLGRPNGVWIDDLSLKKIVFKIKSQTNYKIFFNNLNILKQKPFIIENIKNLQTGQILVLENLRFYEEEYKNSAHFAKQLSELGDLYINDAFSNVHRKHASMHALSFLLPSFAGFELIDEVQNLQKLIIPQKPSVAVFGGIKLDTKFKVIYNLVPKYDFICVGSAISRPFLKVLYGHCGKEDLAINNEFIELAKDLLLRYGSKILLPKDFIITKDPNDFSKVQSKKIEHISQDDYLFDIGPETIKLFSQKIKKAQTFIWNGPLGFFEHKPFKHGTQAMCKIMAARARGKAFGVAGGGDTIIAINQCKVAEYFDFISIGGGAMLEFLYNQNLPGLIGLKKY